MENRKTMVCPINGKKCIEGKRDDFPTIEGTKIPETCRWWIAVQGTQPQQTDITNFYDCSVPWMVTVGVNQSKEACGPTASVDKMVNTVVKILPPKLKMQLMNEGKKDPATLENKINGGSNEEIDGT